MNAALRRSILAAAMIVAALSVLSTRTQAERPRVYAIKGARLIVAPGQAIEGGTIVMRDGLIEAVGRDVKVPSDAVVVDGAGKTVHAGFIDACSDVGLQEGQAGAQDAAAGGAAPQPAKGAVHPVWGIRPERRALDMLSPSEKALERHRRMGFTTALVAPRGGVFRGSSAIINLGVGSVADNVVRPEAAQHIGFDRSSSPDIYPNSLMGVVAAIRQAFEDAQRHESWRSRYQSDPRGMPRPDFVPAYEPIARAGAGKIPVVFHAAGPLDLPRATRLAREYGLDAIVAGSGSDAEALAELRGLGKPTLPMILPLALPEKLMTGDEAENLDLETRTLQRYLQAPANPARMSAAGITFAFGTSGMKDPADAPASIRKAIRAGLDPRTALAALTTVPAELFGLERIMGTLERGKVANVVVIDGDPFSEKTRVVSVFVDGRELPPSEMTVPAGTANPPSAGAEQTPATLAGLGSVPAGAAPPRPTVLFRNATLWTMAGAREGKGGAPGGVAAATTGDLLVRDGKIAAVGGRLQAPAGAEVIDATGKHLTPAIIDAHSHIAVEGDINEDSANFTPEIRITDVLDPGDIDIYRDLAGGVATANVLQGSSDTVGGQAVVIKFRWGETASGIVFKEAPPGIKFALGENPKNANPDHPEQAARYPATRMGVAASIRKAFLEAQDYRREWDTYSSLSRTDRARRAPPRRDLRMEPLLEVLEGKRLVHAHSYRQDEILMLIRVAEEMGFKIASFDHVFEGYKVADEIARHGAGAVTHSDWWAYKLEAWDAIPYGPALMARRGVVVSIGSDSAEVARRLNIEAAKTVKYGGLSPEEALALVTINPARQLRIDKWVGSLEAGKDADLALWSGDPLSVYSVCEQTWVDGIKRFDRAVDMAARGQREAERKALLDAVGPAGERKSEPAGEGAAAGSAQGTPSTPTAAPAQAAPPAPPALPLNYRIPASPQRGAVALVGATVHTVSGADIPGGTVIVRDGVIEAVGKDIEIPKDAAVEKLDGLHVYPGMIDAYTMLGLVEIGSVKGSLDSAEFGQINPDARAEIAFNSGSEAIPVTRANGVTHALVVPRGGLISGTSALMRLDGWTWEDMTAGAPAAIHIQFPGFPSSQDASKEERLKEREKTMRQLDGAFAAARAYGQAMEAGAKGAVRPRRDPALEAMLPVVQGKIPVVVHAQEIRQIRDALRWAREQGVRIILAGAGEDIARAAELLKQRDVPVILTSVLALPRRRDEAYDAPLAAARRLHEAGVSFCIAGGGGASNVRNLPYHAAMAAAFGLPREEALKAVTLHTARILGVGRDLGSIEPGKSASLMVTDGDPLEIRTQVSKVFIDGRLADLMNKQRRLYERYSARPAPAQAR